MSSTAKYGKMVESLKSLAGFVHEIGDKAALTALETVKKALGVEVELTVKVGKSGAKATAKAKPAKPEGDATKSDKPADDAKPTDKPSTPEA